MPRKLRLLVASLATACVLLPASPALAQDKIGFVNTERILRDSAPALHAQEELEREFAKRNEKLQKTQLKLQRMQDELNKEALTISDSQRRAKEREFVDLSRDLQRRRREFNEDLNQRKNEELAKVIGQANRVIRQIAQKEHYDIIFQDAVYASPSIDITNQVLKAMAAQSSKK